MRSILKLNRDRSFSSTTFRAKDLKGAMVMAEIRGNLPDKEGWKTKEGEAGTYFYCNTWRGDRVVFLLPEVKS